MQKLMIVAATAALSMANVAFGEAEMPLEKGVYSVSVTQKGLDYEMKSQTYKQATPRDAEDFLSLAESEEAAVQAGQAAWDNGDITAQYGDYAQLCKLDEITSAEVSKKISGETVVRYVYRVSYAAPKLNSQKNAVTKVVSTTINGLYVTGYGDDRDGTYLWNNLLTGTYNNTYVKADTTKTYSELFETEEAAAQKILDLTEEIGTEVGAVAEGSIQKTNSGKKFKVSWKEITKKNYVKLANGQKADSFRIIADEKSVTSDGKADAGFAWDTLQGWGTGTANKDELGAYATVKTVAGNATDLQDRGYGTWKFQIDAAATKVAEKEGSTIEQILASKKVELCK